MAARVKPLEIIEMALGGSDRPGAAALAEKIALALTNAGWAFCHEDEPRYGLVYRPKAPTIEESIR